MAASTSLEQDGIQGLASQSPPTTSGRSPPRYAAPTGVQPKRPLQEYKNADDEAVKGAYSNTGHLGIRSLPNALHPEFRQKLYDELVDSGKNSNYGRSSPGRNEAAHNASRPLSLKSADGIKMPSKYSPVAGTFSTYEYLPSEYEREKLIARFEKLKNRLKQGASSDFVVRAPPTAPKSAPAFNEFQYVEVPYELTEETRRNLEALTRTQFIDGPFLPSGKYQSKDNLKGMLDECLRLVAAQLSNDWPTSFLQVFEDQSEGSIVITFDKGRAVIEGDLSAYMNHMAKNSLLVSQFHLSKDSVQWGLGDSDSPAVFYVYWPPWLHHRGVVTPELAGPAPQGKPSFLETGGIARASNRVPFGEVTASGLLVTTNTGLYTRSMKY